MESTDGEYESSNGEYGWRVRKGSKYGWRVSSDGE